MNKNELMKLTKSKLEEHGRTIGLELDKRKKKQTLVEEILAHRKTKAVSEQKGLFSWIKSLFS
jgi:hypothetical protein